MPLGLASICREENWKRTDLKKVNSLCCDNNEPTTSFLLMTRSPPTSVSTLSSSSLNADKKDDWANELQPIDGWDTMLSDPVSAAEPGHEQSLLRWISGGDIDEASLLGLKQLLQSGNTTHLDFASTADLGVLDQGSVLDPISSLVSGLDFPSSGFGPDVKLDQVPVTANTTGDACVVGDVQGSNLSNLVASITPHSSMNLVFQSQPQFDQFAGEKPQPLMHQNHILLIPPPYNLQEPPSKRQNSVGSDNHLRSGTGFGCDTNLQVLPQQFQHQPPLMESKAEVLQAHGEEETTENLLDQLYKAAELVGMANFSHAQAILARLNHQLSPVGKPLHRAVYYFKEALQSLLFSGDNPANGNHLTQTPTSLDVIFKMDAYKAFSETSPLIQFVNFTANQAFLEALDHCNKIHIVDFDIGFGAQWASFLQELPLRRNGVAAVRITAVTSTSRHHPIDLVLMHESLTQFSCEVGVGLEFQVINVDCIEQQDTDYSDFMATVRADEAVVVNLPIWCSSGSVIRFIKRISPRIVVCIDGDYGPGTELPFPKHILHALHKCSNLLESIEATTAVANRDAVRRIEKFMVQPAVERSLVGSVSSGEWRKMMGSVGMRQVPFSKFAEAQAECLVKRAPALGFHLDKRHASLLLCWQSRELVAVSAWR